jgi:molybdenum cofactor cytidylyltransferase
MDLKQAFRFPSTPCVAFVGSGGKTTALFQLAREILAPVIVTATTHLHVDQIQMADSHWILEKPEDLAGVEKNLQGVMLFTGPIAGNRTTGLNQELLSTLHAICGSHALPLLIEADGSRQRPLKAPGVDEPPIPDFADTVVVVAGLVGLGHSLTEEVVHRSEIFASLSGLSLGEIITPEALLHVLTHPAGGLKNIPAQARRLVLLNQADTPGLQAQAKSLAENLLKAYQSVVIATLGQSRIHAVYEPVAGIVLAAGEAKRFGRLKQLLDYDGQSFVRTVAETALAGGLSPVVVVSGAQAEAVESAVQDLGLLITRNTAWQIGQSSSIQAGLRVLPARTGAVIFLLADQPQVTPTVIRALLEQHALNLSPIVAPLVAGQRANPVLFDRSTFPGLMTLTGDVGGRAVFSRYQVTYLPWHDERLLTDIDTPADLDRLRNS